MKRAKNERRGAAVALYECAFGAMEIVDDGGAIIMIRPADHNAAGASGSPLAAKDTFAFVESVTLREADPAGVSRCEGELARRRTELTDRARREICEYLLGKRREFTFPIAPRGSAFELAVWEALRAIPYGETRTYGELAAAIGRPGAARAVGRAAGRNALWLAIPCHRLVGAGGVIGGYRWGARLKARLLEIERTNA